MDEEFEEFENLFLLFKIAEEVNQLPIESIPLEDLAIFYHDSYAKKVDDEILERAIAAYRRQNPKQENPEQKNPQQTGEQMQQMVAVQPPNMNRQMRRMCLDGREKTPALLLFLMRGLANAPRTITSWLVRREPKLDRSVLPAATSQSPASVPLRIGATGLM